MNTLGDIALRLYLEDTKKFEQEVGKAGERGGEAAAEEGSKSFIDRLTDKLRGKSLSDLLIGGGAIAGGIAAFKAVEGVMSPVLDKISRGIELAKDKMEDASKVGVIFGDSFHIIEEASKTAVDTVALSSAAYLKSAGDLGNLVKGMGFAGDEAANMSVSMLQLASDMGSFNNASPEEVTYAMGSAFRGEFESIRRFGIVLNADTVALKAVELGLAKNKNAVDAHARATALWTIIQQKAVDAEGDRARTATSLANKQVAASARQEEALIKLGEAFLPIANYLLPAITEASTELIKVFTNMAAIIAPALVAGMNLVQDAVDQVKGAFDSLSQVLGPAGPTVAGIAGFVGTIALALGGAAVVAQVGSAITSMLKGSWGKANASVVRVIGGTAVKHGLIYTAGMKLVEAVEGTLLSVWGAMGRPGAALLARIAAAGGVAGGAYGAAFGAAGATAGAAFAAAATIAILATPVVVAWTFSTDPVKSQESLQDLINGVLGTKLPLTHDFIGDIPSEPTPEQTQGLQNLGENAAQTLSTAFEEQLVAHPAIVKWNGLIGDPTPDVYETNPAMVAWVDANIGFLEQNFKDLSPKLQRFLIDLGHDFSAGLEPVATAIEQTGNELNILIDGFDQAISDHKGIEFAVEHWDALKDVFRELPADMQQFLKANGLITTSMLDTASAARSFGIDWGKLGETARTSIASFLGGIEGMAPGVKEAFKAARQEIKKGMDELRWELAHPQKDEKYLHFLRDQIKIANDLARREMRKGNYEGAALAKERVRLMEGEYDKIKKKKLADKMAGLQLALRQQIDRDHPKAVARIAAEISALTLEIDKLQGFTATFSVNTIPMTKAQQQAHMDIWNRPRPTVPSSGSRDVVTQGFGVTTTSGMSAAMMSGSGLGASTGVQRVEHTHHLDQQTLQAAKDVGFNETALADLVRAGSEGAGHRYALPRRF